MRDPDGDIPGHRPPAIPQNGPYFAIPCEQGCGRPATLVAVADGRLALEIRARHGDELHATVVTLAQLRALAGVAEADSGSARPGAEGALSIPT